MASSQESSRVEGAEEKREEIKRGKGEIEGERRREKEKAREEKEKKRKERERKREVGECVMVKCEVCVRVLIGE